MQLVLEIRDPAQRDWAATPLRRFVERGGVLGRHPACDWILDDPPRHVSNHHAVVSYRDGTFLLTDTSRNGTHDAATGERLPLGVAQTIEHGSSYRLGRLRIDARLESAGHSVEPVAGQPAEAGSVIPDNAFVQPDPLKALAPGTGGLLENLLTTGQAPVLTPPSALDGAGIDTENLTVPRLVAAAIASPDLAAQAAEGPGQSFWSEFAAVLGVSLDDLTCAEREQLALSATALLRQALEGLQHSLRIRCELNDALRLGLSDAFVAGQHPFSQGLDSAGWLALLRQPGAAQVVLGQAMQSLQTHQVALLSASRAVLRTALEHVAPQRLMAQMEHDHRTWLTTDGRRWRAYVRHHQTLSRDDDWTERLLARDFARAYAEQVRLIAPLYTPSQG
ncbi:type VI secretion system-associated FHA domain protein TagH [Pseudomonas syringae]|nr:type VI secretion system-associated FHA domain protein TagH [Pseudomonas syringae]MBD8792834.1 type VI secretion system-associated FHA domain protein TagH [Pseudomonas syringae]MBD8803337.1 type VI secretion system-associated FHA domain protein TagH [Pseudomonas syringae]MBD8811934.1 type VI secretion system-associated FHA domain protein TagH [Pseudomonas syringae]